MFKFLLFASLLVCGLSTPKTFSAKRGMGRSMHSEFQRVNSIGNAMNLASVKGRIQKAIESRSTDIEESAAYGTPETLDYVIDISIEDSTGVYASYALILDTGSSNTAVAVEECSGCGEGSTTLELDYDTDYCIEVTYGSGSWSGYRADTTYVGFVSGDDSLYDDVYISAITSGSDFFTGDYNGIFGLGYIGISESYYSCSSSSSKESGRANSQLSKGESMTTYTTSTPLLDSFYADGLMSEDLFTISYFNDYAYLALGGIDTSLYTGDITYVDTQMVYGEYYGYYLVEITDFAVDGTSLGYGSSTFNTLGGSLVDCGTTLTYLPSAVYDAFETALEDYITNTKFFDWDTCLTSDEITDLPDIEITLSDTLVLTMTSAQYLLNYEGCYYWGASSASYTILGNVIMADRFVVFDRTNNLVGFADAVDITSTSDSVISFSSFGSTSSLALTGSLVAMAVLLVAGVIISRRRNGYTQVPTSGY